MKIGIVGGGSLGHVCAAVLAHQGEHQIVMLTQRPEQWGSEIMVNDLHGRTYCVCLAACSSDPSILTGCELVLLCLPGFLINQYLGRIHPYITRETALGSIVSSTGFFVYAHQIMPTQPMFGFQRTPFIARVDKYGHSAKLLGYKPQVAIAVENITCPDEFRQQIEKLFMTPTILLSSYYEACLTNSNPILHTARLYSMWCGKEKEVQTECSYFYRDWDIASAELLLQMDAEFMQLLDVLPMNKNTIPSLLAYYESTDAASLTAKLSSIEAFQSILSPMKQNEHGWLPDFKSRYFTEDFPYGLRFIVELAHEHKIHVPTLEKVLDWGMAVVNNE